MDQSINISLTNELFQRREHLQEHDHYSEELRTYENIKTGNLDAIDEGCAMFQGPGTGTLSKDRVRNYKYLFVAAVTLATRFAIEGGLNGEVAYTLSDVYINQMDGLTSVDQIFALHRIMLTDFTTRTKECIINEVILSKPVQDAMDYIYSHIHSYITVDELASHVNLTPSYFSCLFKKETGKNVSAYIRTIRVNAAANLLRYSDYSYLDIGNYMAFSSHSHFVSVFKKEMGLTPKAYRERFYSLSWDKSKTEAAKKERNISDA